MNQKHYWLEGAGIMALIFFLLTIFFLAFDHSRGTVIDWVIIFLMTPFASGATFVNTSMFQGFFLQFIVYIVVGIILGWIYGRLRSRIKTNNQL